MRPIQNFCLSVTIFFGGKVLLGSCSRDWDTRLEFDFSDVGLIGLD
jgi:hypothetical protein